MTALGSISRTCLHLDIVLSTAPLNKMFFVCKLGFINIAEQAESPLTISCNSLLARFFLLAKILAFAIMRSIASGFESASCAGMLLFEVLLLHRSNLDRSMSFLRVFGFSSFHIVSLGFFKTSLDFSISSVTSSKVTFF